MMHHAEPQGTALCGATLGPPEVKLCRIIWCVVQREHIVVNRCDLHVVGLNCFQSMQFISVGAFEHFIVHSTKIFCTV